MVLQKPQRFSMWTLFKSGFSLVVVLQVLAIAYAYVSTSEYPLPPRWDYTPQQILDQGQHLNDRIVQFNDHLASLVDDVSVHNVLIPAIHFDNERDSIARHLLFFSYVSTDAKVREAARSFERSYSNLAAEEALREDVYKVFAKLQRQLKSVSFEEKKGNQAILTESKYKGLTAEQSRYLDDTVKDFEKVGLGLPKKRRDHVLELLQESAVLGSEFQENLSEDKAFLLFTKEELEGVPNLDKYKIVKKDGIQYYKVTFQYPDITPVVAYATKESTRKKAYLGNSNRIPENEHVLASLVKLRYKLAKELNYDNFEQYSLLDTLAANETVVADFLHEIKDRITSAGKEELAQLQKLKNGDKVYAWDYSYLNRLYLQQHQVDESHISEYFPADETAANLLGIYEIIFDLKFVEVTKNRQVWHEDVKQYSVWKSNGDFVGTFYFDLYPREGKFTHGANFNINPGYQRPNSEVTSKNKHVDPRRAYPTTALVVNFTKKTKDKPALFKHSEVLTFFHEVGHGIHGLVSRTETARYDGTNVPRDFAEAPSQALEYWTWDKSILKSITTHYRTGKPLDDESIDKLVASKRLNGALGDLLQLHYGLFDQHLHRIATDSDVESLDIQRVWNDLFEKTTLLATGGSQLAGYNSFGHIAAGYEGKYYSYLYSEVFAADIFYTLFKNDPLNVESGRRYRDILLSKGGAQDILASLTELLGRKPNTDAFWKERGL